MPLATQISVIQVFERANVRAACKSVKAFVQEDPLFAPKACGFTYNIFPINVGQASQASPILSPSVSVCVGLKILGQLSHTSPLPSLSVSVCVGFTILEQLSQASPIPSPSVSF